jgi:hypothetical protein
MAEVVVAARRWLKPGSAFMPIRSEAWLAPVSAPAAYRRAVLAGAGHGLRLEAFHRLAVHVPRILEGGGWRLLARPRRAYAFDFLRDPLRPRRARLAFRAARGPVHGLVVFVRVKLSRSVSTGSEDNARWRPMFLPVYEPLPAGPRKG